MIVGMGRYCGGAEVDTAQSQVIRSAGTLTPDAVSLVRAMYERATADPSDFVWIALASPSRKELDALAKVFSIPDLWIADALNPRQRAKAEFAEGVGALIVFKVVVYDEPTSAIETGQIAVMLGPSYVVTVRLGPVGSLGQVRLASTDRPEFLAHGPLSAVHAIADAIVDGYLEAADEIGRDLDTIEEHVFSPQVTDDSEVIYLLKRENLELRRAVAPLVAHAQRLVEGRMPNIPDDLRTHFHDLGDHLLRVNDYVESYESLLVTILQASNARQGLQQNTDMRKMAAYAALLAVPTALAGIYGMNFEHMPELSWLYGYPMVLLVMATILTLMFRAFKRSNWL
ncbi:MAG TPA: magnesium and cobalt transport protein CorA [Motilibacterales bacterium]|nr:magnesium and cobalt transport protein CorA [Motilibacterales bacterium]